METQQNPKKKKKSNAGRKPVIDAEKTRLLKEAIELPMPPVIACDLIGLARQTYYDKFNSDPNFRADINISVAKAGKKLILLTAKQGNAWKLLKNMFRDEFKERIDAEISGKDGEPLELVINDYRSKKK